VIYITEPMKHPTKEIKHEKSAPDGLLKKTGKVFVGGWLTAYEDVMVDFIQPLQNLESILKPGLIVLLSTVITWFIYVPIHELLHVGGCVFTGGSVSELVMGPEYGATFLKNIFPFITPATTQYAGRVTGFEPNGDMGYIVTVFAPFILSLFPGVLCLKLAFKKKKLWLMGPGIVMGLAPFYNLTGDFFEIGTILSTRLVNILFGGQPEMLYTKFWLLRSDDIFRLFSEIVSSPVDYGMNTGLGVFVTVCVIFIGAVLAITFAGWTYLIGRRFAGSR